MNGRKHAPRARDPTQLPGGGGVGWFWKDCKGLRRCNKSPYDRLLTNPVLRADYRATTTRETAAVRKSSKKR